jgi:hypothetical protein
MQDETRAVLLRVFDRLTQEQVDDIESQFENLEVLWQRSVELRSEEGYVHRPALELHVAEFAHELLALLIVASADNMTEGEMQHLIRDYLERVLLYGIEIGQSGWPIPIVKCEEVHAPE